MFRGNKTARASRRAEGGFTLLEVVVSLLIMMIAGLGAASLFAYAVTYNRGASDRARAFAVAQQRMEVIRNTPYNSLNQTFATANTGAVQTGDRNTSDVRRFDVTTTITNEAIVSGTPRRKTITVTVRPQDTAAGSWGSGTITLVTQRASLEIGPN